MTNAASAESSRRLSHDLIYLFGALGGLLFGYDTGVDSSAILFIRPEFGLTPFLEGFVVSSIVLGPLSERAAQDRCSTPWADATSSS